MRTKNLFPFSFSRPHFWGTILKNITKKQKGDSYGQNKFLHNARPARRKSQNPQRKNSQKNQKDSLRHSLQQKKLRLPRRDRPARP